MEENTENVVEAEYCPTGKGADYYECPCCVFNAYCKAYKKLMQESQK